MADLCIVCLGELRTAIAEDPPPEPADSPHALALHLHDDASHGIDAELSANAAAISIDDDEETIAHLLPCKHDLHNACLKPWVERANSCPICRATFNMVELSRIVGGPIVSSYGVQDKVQEAELDPTIIIEDELFAVEAWDPCLVCGLSDDVHESMYCDGCGKAVHVFCAGFEDSPDVWYCESCLLDLETDVGLPGMASAVRRSSRRRPTSNYFRSRRNNPDAVWARVWQEVSRRLDLDLDFPFDDEEPRDERTEEQRREFARWQRRFEVANRQGAATANELREIAHRRIRPPTPPPPPNPESQEELRAWNAFEKARESQDAPPSVRRSKRKATASPASPHEPQIMEPPAQKRPRLRRPIMRSEPRSIAESSTAATQRATDGPTFLSSLLREVETHPALASSPGAVDQHNGHPSPVLSPSSSACGTPRAVSPQRPLSPPLSSESIPTSPPDATLFSPASATFSPFSPVVMSQEDLPSSNLHRHRGRRRQLVENQLSGDEKATTEDRASSASPTRNLSFSTKQEIQRMVKIALGSRYRNKEITKDQYTDINRDVSRKLYDLVGDASALMDRAEREKWQGIAEHEVATLVAALPATTPPS